MDKISSDYTEIVTITIKGFGSEMNWKVHRKEDFDMVYEEIKTLAIPFFNSKFNGEKLGEKE